MAQKIVHRTLPGWRSKSYVSISVEGGDLWPIEVVMNRHTLDLTVIFQDREWEADTTAEFQFFFLRDGYHIPDGTAYLGTVVMDPPSHLVSIFWSAEE